VIRARVADVIYQGRDHQLVVLLQEEEGERVLAIWMEGWAYEDFLFCLRGLSYGPPTFSAFLTQAIAGADAVVEAVRIDADPEPTGSDIWMVIYQARVLLRKGDQRYVVEGRPSYTLPLALSARCPILIEEATLNKWSCVIPAHLAGAVGAGLEFLTKFLRNYQSSTDNSSRGKLKLTRAERARIRAAQQLVVFLWRDKGSRTNRERPKSPHAWWRFWER